MALLPSCGVSVIIIIIKFNRQGPKDLLGFGGHNLH